jgi:putative transposase
MLLRNDLLHYTHPSPRTVRILWIAPEQSHAYVFDVAARSADVELVQLSVLHADIRSGRASVLPADPYLMVVSQDLLPPKHLQLRARAWEIIEPLVALEPGIYEARQRGQLIARATGVHGVSHPTIYRYLRRYWQRGQTPNALLPDYCNSGGKGKVRQASAGVKRGRPRKNGADAGPGLNADEEIRRTFRVAIARYAAGHAKFSRLGAYEQMLDEFFVERRIDEQSGRVLTTPAGRSAVLPTFGQFNYWLDHDDDRPPEVARRSDGPPASWPPAAPNSLTGQPAALAPQALPPGRPGAGFYLDAVCAEVRLVSRADRRQAIGRPRIYLAIDSFSRLVTGVYIGMGPASWPQAMLALANCGADKQRYSQQFGRRIEAAQWPCRHLPETLFANAALTAGWDGGEGALFNNFNLRCVAVDDGPGDWKAVLEKRFRLLAPNEEGVPCRLDGVLDLEQFTRIVVDCILYYNNRHPLRHAGNATPRQLWDWGVAHRGGSLKTYPEHLIRCSLMPVAPAQVGAGGIRLFESTYTCARAINERWFDRARLRGPWSVRVAYDPSNLDMIYLLDPAAPMQFHACHLDDACAAQRNLSAEEIARMPRESSASASAARSASPAFASFAG